MKTITIQSKDNVKNFDIHYHGELMKNYIAASQIDKFEEIKSLSDSEGNPIVFQKENRDIKVIYRNKKSHTGWDTISVNDMLYSMPMPGVNKMLADESYALECFDCCLNSDNTISLTFLSTLIQPGQGPKPDQDFRIQIVFVIRNMPNNPIEWKKEKIANELFVCNTMSARCPKVNYNPDAYNICISNLNPFTDTYPLVVFSGKDGDNNTMNIVDFQKKIRSQNYNEVLSKKINIGISSIFTKIFLQATRENCLIYTSSHKENMLFRIGFERKSKDPIITGAQSENKTIYSLLDVETPLLIGLETSHDGNVEYVSVAKHIEIRKSIPVPINSNIHNPKKIEVNIRNKRTLHLYTLNEDGRLFYWEFGVGGNIEIANDIANMTTFKNPKTNSVDLIYTKKSN